MLVALTLNQRVVLEKESRDRYLPCRRRRPGEALRSMCCTRHHSQQTNWWKKEQCRPMTKTRVEVLTGYLVYREGCERLPHP